MATSVPGGSPGYLRVDVSGDGTAYDYLITPSPVLAANNWYHVATTFKAGVLKLFVNGNLVASKVSPITSLYAAGSTKADIGRAPFAGGRQYFLGLIDEPAIYDRALSPAEIKAIYDAGANGMCGTGCAQSVPGLAGWWPGNGDAGDRGSSDDGTWSGTPAYVAGKVGQGFSLDGASYVTLPDVPQLRFTSQATLEAWINPTDIANYRQIISKFGSAPHLAYQLEVSPGGKLATEYSGDGSSYERVETDVPVLSASSWSHVAMTFNAGLVKLYVNGVEKKSYQSIITSLNGSAGTTPTLGRDPAGVQYFIGSIDEPAMFNRALSAAEIQAIYNAGSSGLCGLGLTVGVDGPAGPASLAGPFEFAPPWPNPAARSTNVRFRLPAVTTVRVEVFDVVGRRVRLLMDSQSLAVGEHRVTWDGRDTEGRRVAGGIYQIRVSAGASLAVRKIVMIQ